MKLTKNRFSFPFNNPSVALTIMLAFIQISKSTQRDDVTFHRSFRNCFPHIKAASPTELHNRISKARPGFIIGAVLFAGYASGAKYFRMMDPANQQYYNHSKKNCKPENIFCYPIIAIIPFEKPIKGVDKGNIAALFIRGNLLRELDLAIGTKRLQALEFLSKQLDVSKYRKMTKRILILRKEHAVNTMLGIKCAEFRTRRIGDNMLAKIQTKKDFAYLLRFKKKPNDKRVQKLKKMFKV